MMLSWIYRENSASRFRIQADTRYFSSRPHKTDILMGTPRQDVTGKGSTAAIIIPRYSEHGSRVYGVSSTISSSWSVSSGYQSGINTIQLYFTRICGGEYKNIITDPWLGSTKQDRGISFNPLFQSLLHSSYEENYFAKIYNLF